MVNLPVLLVTAVLSASPSSEVVLLHFTAQGCRPCQLMVPTVQRLAEEGYPIQSIDIDRHPQAARDWRVEAVPSFILVRAGEEVERVAGPASHDRLVRLFERAAPGPSRPIADRSGTVIRGQSPDEPPTALGSLDREAPRARSSSPDRLAALGRPQTSRSPAGQGPEDGRDPTDAEGIGFAASVKIRVNDGGGTSYGTGTIIDVHEDEALVVTCGHLFRDSRGNGEVLVELLAPEAGGRTVRGHVLSWDADARDIALVVIRPGVPVRPAPVASSLAGVQRGAAVFSVGCNHGGEPSLVRSTVAAVDRYTNAPNIVVAGQPVDGRSGGGLFSREGQLIGICNAADPTDDEGIYASLPTIHEELDRIGLSRIYAAPGDIALAPPPASSQRSMPAPPPVDLLPLADRFTDERPDTRAFDKDGADGVPLSELITALENGHEVICIIRTPNAKEARVVFLDEESQQLLSRLSPPRPRRARQDELDRKTAASPVPTQWRQ
jgi:thiol-disulfide isomerase/thioredoxin